MPFRGETKTPSLSTRSGNGSRKGNRRGASLTEKHNSRRVLLGRVLFPFGLCVVATILAVSAHVLLTRGEQELAISHFESIADRALGSAQGIMKRKRLGTVSMASIIANANPDADDWPFVTMNGYDEISNNLIQTSSGREMALCPLVRPAQLPDFENFAYDYFENSRKPPLPNGTGVSSFGKGVFSIDQALNTSDNRYHETDGQTTYDSPNRILTPILEVSRGALSVLMLNVRYEEIRGLAIDNLIDCARGKAESGDRSTECITITDMVFLATLEDRDPAALIMQPVYPAMNDTVLTGIVLSSIVWSETLQDGFTSEVSGIDCILETETQFHTYSIRNGVAHVRGEGEFFDRKFEGFKRQIVLTSPELYGSSSAMYTLSLYPSEEFFQVYSTNNPRLAAVGAASIVILISIVFFLYDFFVRQELRAKGELLEAKRKFMRFVSHEVRTPLNSVCMGLTLMRDEIQRSLGMCESWDAEDVSSASCTFEKKEVSRKKVLELLRLTEDIFGNAQSSVDVLNDLLNYDKIEMGTFRLAFSVIPIWQLIESTWTEFKLPAAKKKIDLKLDLASLYGSIVVSDSTHMNAKNVPIDVQNAKVVGDTIRITQSVRNLISNAIKFTPEGGSVTVRVMWHKLDDMRSNNTTAVTTEFILNNNNVVQYPSVGQLELSVSDTGAGMSPGQLSQLFGDGVQFNVNELQSGQGSGLGLFITKGIVNQHGGSLLASSQGIGKGTTFSMTLPLHCVPDEVQCDPEDPTEPSSSDGDSRGGSPLPLKKKALRILIVDDSVTNRKFLKRLLQKDGHVCEVAQDGQEAVDQVTKAAQENCRYDAILMDSEMPRKNGPTATKELRRIGNDSIIVGITGNVLPEDIAHFEACGANGVLPKPLKMSALESLWVKCGLIERL